MEKHFAYRASKEGSGRLSVDPFRDSSLGFRA